MCSCIVRTLAAAAILAIAARAHGQTPQNPAEAAGNILRNDNNPTRPVLFSIRPEFDNPSEDVKQAALIFRYDQAALRARRFLPRVELPARGASFRAPLQTTLVGARRFRVEDRLAESLAHRDEVGNAARAKPVTRPGRLGKTGTVVGTQ